MNQWVPKLGLYDLKHEGNCWRAVSSFRPSGSGTPLEKRERNLAIYDTGKIRDYAGERYNAISLVAVCLFVATPLKAALKPASGSAMRSASMTRLPLRRIIRLSRHMRTIAFRLTKHPSPCVPFLARDSRTPSLPVVLLVLPVLPSMLSMPTIRRGAKSCGLITNPWSRLFRPRRESARPIYREKGSYPASEARL